MAQERLNNLVFVKYNRDLEPRFNIQDVTDHILLSDIDDSNEWLMGRMEDEDAGGDDFVFQNESLRLRDIGRASGVLGPSHNTRGNTNTRDHASSSKSTRILMDEDEDINLVGAELLCDEGEDDYHLSKDSFRPRIRVSFTFLHLFYKNDNK